MLLSERQSPDGLHDQFGRHRTTVQNENSGLVLITGCPRSGTKYIASVLQGLGLDVSHERIGREGISSWCMAVDADDAPWGPPRRSLSFRIAIHQVRNPVAVIASLSTLKEHSWRFAYAHTNCRPEEPLLLRSAKLWYSWNRHAQAIASWRYRIEQLPDIFQEFCRRVGVKANPQVLEAVGPNVNTRAFRGLPRLCNRMYEKLGLDAPAFLRNHYVDRTVYEHAPAFIWNGLREVDPLTCDQVLALAQEYGYSDAELGLD